MGEPSDALVEVEPMPSSPPNVPAALVDVLPTLSRAAGSANQYCRIPLPFQSPILSLPNDRAGGRAISRTPRVLVEGGARGGKGEKGKGWVGERGTKLYRRPALGLPATAWRLALALRFQESSMCVSLDIILMAEIKMFAHKNHTRTF